MADRAPADTLRLNADDHARFLNGLYEPGEAADRGVYADALEEDGRYPFLAGLLRDCHGRERPYPFGLRAQWHNARLAGGAPRPLFRASARPRRPRRVLAALTHRGSIVAWQWRPLNDDLLGAYKGFAEPADALEVLDCFDALRPMLYGHADRERLRQLQEQIDRLRVIHGPLPQRIVNAARLEYGVSDDFSTMTPNCANVWNANLWRLYEQIPEEQRRLGADLYDAWEGEGNSKRITFENWLKAMADNDRGTLQEAARELLGHWKAALEGVPGAP